MPTEMIDKEHETFFPLLHAMIRDTSVADQEKENQRACEVMVWGMGETVSATRRDGHDSQGLGLDLHRGMPLQALATMPRGRITDGPGEEQGRIRWLGAGEPAQHPGAPV
jgi:hypothetical protein